MNLFFKGYNWNSNRGLSLGLLLADLSTGVGVTPSNNDNKGINIGFLNNNCYFFSLIAAYPRPAQLGFQEPVTPVMEGIIDFHHDLMFFLAFILGFVCWFLVNIGYSFFSRLPENPSNHHFVPFIRVPSRKNHHLWLEIIWTIIPALILVSIVLPSFALIYSMDEFFLHPRLTLKAIGNQWYWTYNYGCALEYNPKNFAVPDPRIDDLTNFLMSLHDKEALDFFFENWANFYEDHENEDVIDVLKESAVETMVYYRLSSDNDDLYDRISNGVFDVKLEIEFLALRALCNYEHFANRIVLQRLSPDLEATLENIKIDVVESVVAEVIFPEVAELEERISRGDIPAESDLKQIGYHALSLYSDFSEAVNLKKETLSQDSTVSHHFALKFDSYMKTEDQLTSGQIRLLEVDKRVLLPTLTGIRLLVSSYDVLHSWAVPSFGVKLDGCPGRLNQTFLYIKEEGLFYGQCSEICGVNHAFMPIAIRTISPNQFNFWLAQRIEVFDNLIKESLLKKTETDQIKHCAQLAEYTKIPDDLRQCMATATCTEKEYLILISLVAEEYKEKKQTQTNDSCFAETIVPIIIEMLKNGKKK